MELTLALIASGVAAILALKGQRFAQSALLTIALTFSLCAWSGEHTVAAQDWRVRQAPRYFVSGVLFQARGADKSGIQLLQSIESAPNADAALGAFTRKALSQYPGYSLLDTVVTEVPSDCGYQASI